MITLTQARALTTSAGVLASKLATSAQLTGHIKAAIKVANENKISVSNIHFDLFGKPGGDPIAGLFSEDEALLLPEVGSEQGKTSDKPYDLFTYKDAEGRERKDVSWWRLVAEQHPIGAGYMDEFEALRVCEQVNNKYTSMSVAERKKIKADLKADFNTFYSKLRLAVMCYHMMIDVSERLDGIVIVDYAMKPKLGDDKRAIKGGDGKVIMIVDRDSPQVIEVTDATNPKTGKFFTMANFVRLNVELTLAGEKNYGAFITSNKRGDGDEEETEDEGIKVTTPKQFEDATIAIEHYINAGKKDTALFRGLVSYYTASNADDRIKTLANMVDLLAMLTEHKDVKAKLDAITFDGTVADKKAA